MQRFVTLAIVALVLLPFQARGLAAEKLAVGTVAAVTDRPDSAPHNKSAWVDFMDRENAFCDLEGWLETHDSAGAGTPSQWRSRIKGYDQIRVGATVKVVQIDTPTCAGDEAYALVSIVTGTSRFGTTKGWIATKNLWKP